MPIDYIEMIPDTDLGIFQVNQRKPIQYMNRLFYPSAITTGVGFPKSWTSRSPKEKNDFYHKVDLLKGKHLIENSIWKYVHGNNHCSMSLSDCYQGLEQLSTELGWETLSFGVDHVELGVYFQLHFDLISKLRMTYKGSSFDAMKPKRSREIYGWHLALNQYEIKLYDVRAKQHLAGEAVTAPPGSYRFEIKYYDRALIKGNGVAAVVHFFESDLPLYAHWRKVVDGIIFKLFPNIPATIKSSDIKNVSLYYSDGFPEFQRIMRQKNAGRTDIERVKNSVKKYSHLLNSKVDLKRLLLSELNRNLL